MNQLSHPQTQSGIYRRKRMDHLESISGKKFCTSCGTTKPVEQVKIYKSDNGKQGMPRCDQCQARRVEFMKGKK